MTSNLEYNLADEPWITVRFTDGAVGSVGLRELLLRSTEISDIVVDPVLAYPVILRIATAIVLRSHNAPLTSPSHTEWQEWAESLLGEGVNPDMVNQYIDENFDYFWLLHPERPFLQDAAISSQCEKTSSTNKLRIDVASGNNPVWASNDTFDAEAPVLAHKEAAIHLCAQWGYGAGGRCSSRSGVANSLQSPLRNRTVFIPLGANLWETLLLQCVPAKNDHIQANNDYCQWERSPQTTNTLRSGPLTRLTGSPRGVLLVGDKNGVHDCYLTWGEEFNETVWEQETSSALKMDKKGSRFAYKVSMDRGTWADLPALLESLSPTASEGIERPACLNPSQHPLGSSLAYFDARVQAVTHFADKSKDEEWSVATTPGLVHAIRELNPVLYGAVRQFCFYADETIRATLRYANNIQGEKHGKGNKESRPAVFKVGTLDFKRRLWLNMETALGRILHGAEWENEAQALSRWLLASFDAQTVSLTSADSLASVAQTRKKLAGALYNISNKFGLVENASAINNEPGKEKTVP